MLRRVALIVRRAILGSLTSMLVVAVAVFVELCRFLAAFLARLGWCSWCSQGHSALWLCSLEHWRSLLEVHVVERVPGSDAAEFCAEAPDFGVQHGGQ